jgi:hypothetical protein
MSVEDKAKTTKWVKFAERPSYPFTADALMGGAGHEDFAAISMPGYSFNVLFQDNCVYYDQASQEHNLTLIGDFLSKNSIFWFSQKLNEIHESNLTKVKHLLKAIVVFCLLK